MLSTAPALRAAVRVLAAFVVASARAVRRGDEAVGIELEEQRCHAWFAARALGRLRARARRPTRGDPRRSPRTQRGSVVVRARWAGSARQKGGHGYFVQAFDLRSVPPPSRFSLRSRARPRNATAHWSHLVFAEENVREV